VGPEVTTDLRQQSWHCHRHGVRESAGRLHHPLRGPVPSAPLSAVQRGERGLRLPWQDAVAKGGQLLGLTQPTSRIGQPSLRQAHQPFDEQWRGARSGVFVQDGGCWSGSSGDALPSDDRSGVTSPASKNSSISAKVASGERRPPDFVTRSITW